MTEVDCFKGQMEMREEEEAQVKAASKKNARLSSASKPRFYSVKRSSETEGHLYRTRLFTPFHSRVFKVFLNLFICSTRLLLAAPSNCFDNNPVITTTTPTR